ncbi:acetate--CoA ligase family protein [Rhodoligotrophos defluvii]|uniref:acetate--CoA ligase family protein n=1 Tax=Rhodoligotrophos defluvii TaxID=2561934 RepID=UPI0014856ED7|nr:acetate--CoA ligase family protein [Rhodoligotrophos defluvii]
MHAIPGQGRKIEETATLARHRPLRHRLDPLLRPASVAFVGASPRPDTPGNTMVRDAARDGFGGRLYAVNPKYDAVEGVACFPDLASLPETVEHVVLGVANEALEEHLLGVVRHGARAATIFASCDLTGRPDDRLAARIADIAREAGLAICGGNGMGFLNPPLGLRVSGYAAGPRLKPGGTAFITQSGSAFSALAYSDRRLKFSLCVSSGRELTTTAADYVDWALDQPETQVIGLFLETARQPELFMRALQKADERDVPVVVLKVGRTELSAGFAASHSGAIAGDDAAYEALFNKWSVVTVDTLDQLAANLLLFAVGRPAAPGGLASLHDSGGEREMVADLAAKFAVPFAAVSQQTLDALRPHLDSGLKPANPLDVWGSGRDFEHHVEACMAAMLADPDTALGVLFQDVRDGSYIAEGFTRAVIRASAGSDKPVAVVTNYAGVNHRSIALATTEAGVPVIDGTEEGLHAIRSLLRLRDRKRTAHEHLPPVADHVKHRWRARLMRGAPLDELEGLALLADYGIRTSQACLVDSVEAAIAAARHIGFPVALKTAAPGILHKTEVDGVKLGLADEASLMAAYGDMVQRLGPRAIVAEMASPGIELGLGMIHDPQFGPYLVVASGGIWIELLKDRAVAMPPVSLQQAAMLVGQLKLAPLLDGRRGLAAADKRALYEAVVRFSQIGADLGDLIAEMDVNPLIVSEHGCFAVDALVLGKAAPDQQGAGVAGA